jgi:pimeloyl-ACP methyl ester carboxylesterase
MTALSDASAPPNPFSQPSLAVRAPLPVRLMFNLGGMLAPTATARFVERRMFRPRWRTAANSPLDHTRPTIHWPPLPEGELAAYSWGKSSSFVLLVHGWEGCSADYSDFIAPLLAAGLRVVAFDAPAHGESSGEETDVRDMALAIKDIVEHFGEPGAIVAHSIGAAAVAMYLSELADGLLPERLALIAPGGDLESEVARVADSLGLPRSAHTALCARVEQRYGRPIKSCSTLKALADLALPTLVVHDGSDRVVPVTEGERIAAGIQSARLIRTEGLGHRRILRDAEVIRSIVSFIAT